MATPIKWGSEFLVNTTTEGSQFEPTVTALPDGRFVMAWADFSETGGDTSSSAVRGQIFNADGSKSGSEFLVNTTTGNNQLSATIAALPEGRFVVAWRDSSQSGDDTSSLAVRAQVFNADGSKFGGEFLVNTATDGAQSQQTITALADGRFVVAWSDGSQSGGDASGTAVRAQIFNADGSKSGGEFLVNTTTLVAQVTPTIAALADGRFVVTWRDNSNSGGDTSGLAAVRAQIFNADGSRSGSEFLVNTTTDSSQREPTITALADGRFVVAWSDDSESGDDTSGSAVRAQVFNADGSKSGNEFLVNTTTESDQFVPTITALTDGRFVAVWSDFSQSGEDTSANAVRAQVFNADGSKSGDEFLVNTSTDESQSEPTVAALADGRFVVAWGDDSQSGGDTTGSAVRAQIFDPREGPVSLAGTPLADEFFGTPFGDTIGGAAGADRLTGMGGDDTIDGGAGADIMRGGAGNDTYVVDDLGDVVDEGAPGSDGIDTVLASIGFALGAGFENLTLTGSAAINGAGNELANTIAGNGAANALAGGLGDDVLDGAAGADLLQGGLGNDLLAGGGDKDQFLFDTRLDAASNVDRIADFVHKQDKILLDRDVFKKLGLGKLDKDDFFRGKKADDDQDHVIYNKKTGALLYDKDGEGGAKAKLFAVLDDSPNDISAKDFLIVA